MLEDARQRLERLSRDRLKVASDFLAYQLAVRRGCDVDQPRHLAKSVTAE
jgi:glucosamine 6-phosphate synthetase-like amidotransferase/phosphosugar isomerase protein